MNRVVSGALYARGYLIARERVDDAMALLNWTYCNVGIGRNLFYVYVDPRNGWHCSRSDSHFCFLLGCVLDPQDSTLELSRISAKILSLIKNQDDLLDYLDILCGRFLVMYGDETSAKVVQDATGMRTCYYGDRFVASHYELINELEPHSPVAFWQRYKELSFPKPFYLPGDVTPYDGIRALIPNHELDMSTHTVRRIFPRRAVEPCSVNAFIDFFGDLICREAECLASKYHLAVSITGGNDSRVTLSALKGIRERVTLFTYNKHTTDNPQRGETGGFDNQMALRLASNYGFKHLVLDLNPQEVSEELVAILRRNHFHAHVDETVPAYLRAFGTDSVLHLRSNLLEIVRDRSYLRLQNGVCSPQSIARMFYGRNDVGVNEVLPYYEDFYQRNSYDKIYGYDASELLYWEVRMGLWHAGVLLTSDIAFDTYCLFNQRKLLQFGLSVPTIYRRSIFAVERVIEKLWPELMFWIPNRNENLLQQRSSLASYFTRWVENVAVNSTVSDYYKMVSPLGVEIGFARNVRHKGDKITISFQVRFEQGGRIVFLVTGVSFWDNRNLKGLVYRVRVNGVVIHQGNCDWLRQQPLWVCHTVEEKRGSVPVCVDLESMEDIDFGENTFVLRVSEFSGYFPLPSHDIKGVVEPCEK